MNSHFLVLLLLVCSSFFGRASILSAEEFSINFFDSKDAKEKCNWSDKERFTVHPDGLGWEGAANEFRPFHFITKPIAVGLAWRPASSVSIEARIAPSPQPVRLTTGLTNIHQPGRLFIRYSPDEKHWSTWQACTSVSRPLKKEDEVVFDAFPAVPETERTEYNALNEKYSKMDVPWGSDENAAVKWILSNDPKFFEKHLPFIGYVQFLYENSLFGTQRIQRFNVMIGFGLSGLAMVPKDPKVSRPEGPWRFKAE